MASSLQQGESQVKLSDFGQNGVILLNDTTSITGNFRKIQVLANAVINTITSNYTKNGEVNPAIPADFGTLAAGTILYGKFTTVKLTSGTVLLFK